MPTLSQSPFHLLRSDLLEADLFKTLERQVASADMHKPDQVPAAEVHETDDAYVIALELPGVDKTSIDVKPTDRDGLLMVTAPKAQNLTTVQAQVEG